MLSLSPILLFPGCYKFLLRTKKVFFPPSPCPPSSVLLFFSSPALIFIFKCCWQLCSLWEKLLTWCLTLDTGIMAVWGWQGRSWLVICLYLSLEGHCAVLYYLKLTQGTGRQWWNFPRGIRTHVDDPRDNLHFILYHHHEHHLWCSEVHFHFLTSWWNP